MKDTLPRNDKPVSGRGFPCGIRPQVALLEQDGNALSILGRCQAAARTEGVPATEISDFIDIATSDDYNHLLQTVIAHFDT